MTDLHEEYEKSATRWDADFSAEAMNSHYVRACWRAFERMLGAQTNGALAVELGVGTGLFTDRLAPRFKRLVVVDFSPQMLDALRPKLAARGVDNVDYVCARAEAVGSVVDGGADMVCCFGLLENITDLTPLFREVRRMLKPGGRFVGVASNGSCPWYALRARMSGDKWYWRDVHLCTGSELRDVARTAGLETHTITGWGLIPSQLPESALLAPVAAVERILEFTPLRRWMGGLAFRFDAR
jgi:ubiquinone/menaquinone biosynthesis C-methylase UbiE